MEGGTNYGKNTIKSSSLIMLKKKILSDYP